MGLLERLEERWERMDGAAARKINRILLERREAASEIKRLRDLIEEVGSGDWTNAAYALELPSRLAESGWFKRARAALT